MKRIKNILAAFVLLGVLFVFAPPAHADETDEVVQLLTAFATKTLNNADFVKTCMGFPALPALCNAGNTPGIGLVCPPPPTPTPAPHLCEVFTSAQADANIGTKVGQLIKLNGEFTMHFLMIGEEKSIQHAHKADCSGGGCSAQYVDRQDTVNVFFAMAQKGKISVTPPADLAAATSFGVGVEKLTKFMIGAHHYCTKVDHGQPLSCGNKSSSSTGGPITPGGSTGGDQTGGGEGGGIIVEPFPGGDATEPVLCDPNQEPPAGGGGH